MTLGIYTIEKTLFEGDVKEIIAKTTSGEITILPLHAPIVSELVSGSLTVIDSEDKKQFFEIERGFIEVRPESHVVILVGAH